jgi:hypothetical protein
LEALLNPALLQFLADGGGPAIVFAVVGYALWREIKRDKPSPPPADDVAKVLADLRGEVRGLAERQTELRIDLAGRLAKIETRLDAIEKTHD